MWVQVLGSGCSAGFPAWNEGSEAAARARANDPSMPIREAAALAVSADGEHYSILEAPLHLPSTLARAPGFAPRTGTRATPIDALVLTCADPTASAGALGLASALSVRILSPIGLRDALVEHDACFRALEPTWTGVPWDRTFPLDRDGMLEVRFFPLPGPTPVHLRDAGASSGRARAGVRITDLRTGSRLVWAPRIARFDSACLAELRGAEVRFVDGTCYAESELRSAHPGIRNPSDAGHTPIDGRAGSLVWLSGMRGDSYYIHLAGGNPACDLKSPESERIRTADVEIALDGLEFEL
jgi:pyrroloquinoline quinone biosynthesis protein B